VKKIKKQFQGIAAKASNDSRNALFGNFKNQSNICLFYLFFYYLCIKLVQCNYFTFSYKTK